MIQALTAALVLGTAAPPPSLQQTTFHVGVDTAAEHRALIGLGGVLDGPDLHEAAAAGIPIRVRVTVELWRDGFFDSLEGTERWSATVVHEPLERTFVVHVGGGRAPRRYTDFAGARSAIERSHGLDLRPRRAGRYYYLARLEIETLSASDLRELELWLRGELGPDSVGETSFFDALEAGARRALIRLLDLPDRRREARSGQFHVPGPG